MVSGHPAGRRRMGGWSGWKSLALFATMASSAGGVSWSRAASPMAAALPEVAPLSTIKAPESSAKGATARLKIDRTFGWRAASKLPSRIMIDLDFRLTLDAAVPGVSRACSSIGGFIVYSFAWWIQYHTRAGRLSPALKIGHPCRLWWDRRFAGSGGTGGFACQA